MQVPPLELKVISSYPLILCRSVASWHQWAMCGIFSKPCGKTAEKSFLDVTKYTLIQYLLEPILE